MASYCKKDYKNQVNNKYEQYLSERNINQQQPPLQQHQQQPPLQQHQQHQQQPLQQQHQQQPPQHQPMTNQEAYTKDEFLDEIMKIHNDIYFNPYKILNIDKNYTPETLKTTYKSLAMKHHPDKGGDSEYFKDITQSYLYLLKKYKENLPDKQIYELKDEFDDYKKNEKKNNNILLKDKNFNLNQFNNVFDDNFKTHSKGYGDFLKNNVENDNKKDSYIFSDTFNVNVFNKIFNIKTKKKKKDTLIVYKEPETIFQSNNDFMELDENDELEDYTSGFTFNKKMHYTDCKRAYTNPEDLSDINIQQYESIDDLENKRSNITYKMTEKEQSDYNKYLEYKKLKEFEKQKKIEKKDLNILKKYKQFNHSMLESNLDN